MAMRRMVARGSCSRSPVAQERLLEGRMLRVAAQHQQPRLRRLFASRHDGRKESPQTFVQRF